MDTDITLSSEGETEVGRYEGALVCLLSLIFLRGSCRLVNLVVGVGM